MGGRIVVFGATGYTGRLVATSLAAAGARPVLAARDSQRLAEVAAAMPGEVETAKADVYRQNSVFSLVEAGDVLVSTVGPFVKYGDVAVRAAIAAGATYIDSTGEPMFIRRVFEDFDGPARSAGARLLPAMGYDFAPGALAGALALREAGDAAVRVDVAYFAFGLPGAAGSAGTKESLVGAALDPGFAFRDGRLVAERGAARVRSFEAGGRPREAFSVGGAEHFTLPAAFPGLRDVNAYIGGPGPLTRVMPAGSLAGELLTRVPGTRPLLRAAGERLVALAPSRTPETEMQAQTRVVAEAFAPGGERLARAVLDGGDPYDFTGRFIAWAARRAAAGEIAGAGALSPLVAFGLDALQAGCGEAGLTAAPSGR